MKHPSWLNRTEYPFAYHSVQLSVGTIHYVDEGNGEIIFFLHGNPGWSFEFRHIIKSLRNSYRCIAADMPGFGLSEKPYTWNYRPESQAEVMEELIAHLQIKHITFVLNDWGGPIALSYAVKHPQNIKALVLANTWMWPVNNSLKFWLFSKIMGGSIGRVLCERFNFFATVITRLVAGKPANISREGYRHLRAHLPSISDRKGTWVLPKSFLSSTQWLSGLWEQRHKIQTKPVLLIWGMKDPAFTKKHLHIWQDFLKNSETVKLEKAGHFPQEEEWERFCEELKMFLSRALFPNKN